MQFVQQTVVPPDKIRQGLWCFYRSQPLFGLTFDMRVSLLRSTIVFYWMVAFVAPKNAFYSVMGVHQILVYYSIMTTPILEKGRHL
ncbi:hypothetical protein D9M71_714100 [compost metagenome]